MTIVPEAVRGNAGIFATLAVVVDGTPGTATDYSGNLKAVNIGSEDKDDSDLTFYEAAQGETKDYTVTLTALQSTVAGSLWRLLWDNPGGEFDLVYGPHGNATITADKPHFLMRLKADGRPVIGNTARRAKDREEFEYTLEVVGAITLDDDPLA